MRALGIALAMTRGFSSAPMRWLAAAMLLVSPCGAQTPTSSEFEGTLFRGVSLGAEAPTIEMRGIPLEKLLRPVSSAQKPPPESAAVPASVPPKRFWTAAGEMVLLEVLPWA